MKIVTIRLDDDTYNKLDSMLKEIGQTKQTFYETYTKAFINETPIPFDIKATTSFEDKMKAYERLENLKRNSPINEDFDKEREEVMKEKYGVID